MDPEADDLRTAAYEVLRDVVRSADFTSEYPNMSAAFDDGALRTLIDLAWRHQFDTDRYPFRREMNELQVYVSRRAKEAMSE